MLKDKRKRREEEEKKIRKNKEKWSNQGVSSLDDEERFLLLESLLKFPRETDNRWILIAAELAKEVVMEPDQVEYMQYELSASS